MAAKDHHHHHHQSCCCCCINNNNINKFHSLCYLLFALSTLSSLSFVYWSQFSINNSNNNNSISNTSISIDLLSYPKAWNHLAFPPNPNPKLKIALFVKRWPQQNLAGGLERHALTLHLALAKRGHEVHVFTTNTSSSSSNLSLKFGGGGGGGGVILHRTPPSPGGYLDQAPAWEQFRAENASSSPFDVVHTESVGLFHGRARNLTRLAVSWHGIAYETIHSDIVQELLRPPGDKARGPGERVAKVVGEVKFFRDYAHHVATSDHVGDVLRRIYMIPAGRVHVIVNGVDEDVYRPHPLRGKEFRRKVGVPEDAALVIGLAGRLVKDKGHPLMHQALADLLSSSVLGPGVFVLVAGDGPWGTRYKGLGPNVLVLGPLDQDRLAAFYNSLDVFVNPTLRAQGLDHTFIEAMLSGVAVMGTRFASVTGSLIVGPEVGYTFLPAADSLRGTLEKVLRDGRGVLETKGAAARDRAFRLFTATKMASAYERLFLCISKQGEYCKYQLP